MQRNPLHHYITDPSPPRTPKAAGNSSVGNGKNIVPAPLRAATIVSIIVSTATPQSHHLLPLHFS